MAPRNPVTRDALGRLAPGSIIATKKNRRTLHKLIDKWLGDDAEGVISFLAGVVKGTERIPLRAPAQGEDSVSAALIPQVEPSIKERIQAAEILLAYRHGKPAQGIELSASLGDDDGNDPEFVSDVDYSKLSDHELAKLEELTQKTLRERGIVNAEFEVKT